MQVLTLEVATDDALCILRWQGEGFTYEVPTRSAINQLYIAELDRIVLSDKVRVCHVYAYV